ncbi:hypothetical protein QLQ12_02600 [Actinoplanes sp. NEAU-A12]|uniref:EF-hand domain-containing protein n=1 Tax=Actinoplanes sandaracinus TaxID=3045177 RepID=A0ABT6WCQ9_9ACTN|nr:hypothetical protein [Actinoplanes sandaracinus]MDI6097488.1 hypothetical protein [Actinoplanes sandaracinus]
MTTPEPYGLDPVTEVLEIPSPRRLRRVHLAVAGVSALAGAAAVVAVLLLTGWREVPVNQYEVRVFFTDEATAAQKETVRAALDDLPFDGDGRLLTREEALVLMRKVYADRGTPLPDTIKADSVAEMAVVATSGRYLDCAPLSSLKDRPGVRAFHVFQARDETVLIAVEQC